MRFGLGWRVAVIEDAFTELLLDVIASPFGSENDMLDQVGAITVRQVPSRIPASVLHKLYNAATIGVCKHAGWKPAVQKRRR